MFRRLALMVIVLAAGCARLPESRVTAAGAIEPAGAHSFMGGAVMGGVMDGAVVRGAMANDALPTRASGRGFASLPEVSLPIPHCNRGYCPAA